MSHIILIFINYLKRTNSFYRFVFVGVINTCVGLSVIFMLMNVFQFSYWVATFTGNTIGAAVSFILNRNFTFNSKTTYGQGSIRFVAVIIFCYFLSYGFSDLITKLFIQNIHFPFNISQKNISVLLGTIFYALSNYIGQKYCVFTDRDNKTKVFSSKLRYRYRPQR